MDWPPKAIHNDLMRKEWAALAPFLALVFLWLYVPAVFATADYSFAFRRQTWCGGPVALRVWEPLPTVVTFAPRKPVETLSGARSLEAQAPLSATAGTQEELKQVRLSWLRATALQSVLLVAVLFRRTQLAQNGRRLAGWLRRHWSREAAIPAILLAAFIVLAVLTVLGPQVPSTCNGLTVVVGNNGPDEAAAGSDLGHVNALAAQLDIGLSIRPHVGFAALSWSSLSLTALVLMLSLWPEGSGNTETNARPAR